MAGAEFHRLKVAGVAARQHERISVGSRLILRAFWSVWDKRPRPASPYPQLGRGRGADMAWRRATAAAAVSTLVVLSTEALAKDLPIWMPPDARAAAAAESGAYVWVDGARHSLRLPAFALGFKTFD